MNRKDVRTKVSCPCGSKCKTRAPLTVLYDQSQKKPVKIINSCGHNCRGLLYTISLLDLRTLRKQTVIELINTCKQSQLYSPREKGAGMCQMRSYPLWTELGALACSHNMKTPSSSASNTTCSPAENQSVERAPLKSEVEAIELSRLLSLS